jgi:hypothetical protein
VPPIAMTDHDTVRMAAATNNTPPGIPVLATTKTGQLMLKCLGPSPSTVVPMVPSPSHIKYQDMELVHHYSFNADKFIMLRDITDTDIWLQVVPRVSFSVPYLADSLLAMSALHLQHLTKGARDLHGYAVQKYYSAMTLSQVYDTSTCCEAKFLTSCFLMMLGFAFDDILPLVGNGSGLDVFGLARGPRMLAENMIVLLKDGPLASLMFTLPTSDLRDANRPRLDAFERLLEVCDTLDDSESLIQPLGALPRTTKKAPILGGGPRIQGRFSVEVPQQWIHDDDSTAASNRGSRTNSTSDGSAERYLSPPVTERTIPTTSHDTTVYRQAIEMLFLIVKWAIHHNSSPLLISWMTIVSSEFLMLARQNRPFAKIIIAYHLATLHACSNYFWIGSRPAREVIKIAQELGPQWEPLMQWPVSLVHHKSVRLADLMDFINDDLPELRPDFIYT